MYRNNSTKTQNQNPKPKKKNTHLSPHPHPHPHPLPHQIPKFPSQNLDFRIRNPCSLELLWKINTQSAYLYSRRSNLDPNHTQPTRLNSSLATKKKEKKKGYLPVSASTRMLFTYFNFNFFGNFLSLAKKKRKKERRQRHTPYGRARVPWGLELRAARSQPPRPSPPPITKKQRKAKKIPPR